MKPCPFCNAKLEERSFEGRHWDHPDNSADLGFDCIAVNVTLWDGTDDLKAWDLRQGVPQDA